MTRASCRGRLVFARPRAIKGQYMIRDQR